MATEQIDFSFIVPVFNESAGLEAFNDSLRAVIPKSSEIIYCDDGSSDSSSQLIKSFRKEDKRIKLLSLSRNFGKEIATTAGIHAAKGKAILTIDADGQHPVELIPRFIESWQNGNKVVIGLRTSNQSEGPLKRYGSKMFYRIFNRFTGLHLVPGSTDFRLIDRAVQAEFIKMTERNRITRGLIDWLGYQRDFIEFKANARMAGDAAYSFKKLVKLAVDSIISLSISPLYVTAYIGAFVLPASIILGGFMIVNALIGDPANLHATGTAYLTVLLMFLVGILLVSQGIIGLYLSHIHVETQNRPLYVIDNEKSVL